MIRVGTHTIEDKGFAAVMETVGGVRQRIFLLELPGAIDQETLEALCSGPIEVVNAAGIVDGTNDGPFRVVSHSLKLARTGDNASALNAQVIALENELASARSANASTQSELEGLRAQLSALKDTAVTAVSNSAGAEKPAAVTD